VFLLTKTHLGKARATETENSKIGLTSEPRFEGLRVVAIKITVLWGVPRRGLVGKCQQFGWTFCPLPQEIGVSLQNSAICSYSLVYTKAQIATLAFSGTDAMIVHRWVETWFELPCSRLYW